MKPTSGTTRQGGGIGRRIGLAIERRGSSQSAVAKHFGITQSAVNQWIAKDKAPRSERLAALARLLGIELPWLLSGEGRMASDLPAESAGALSPDLSITSPVHKSEVVFAGPRGGSRVRDLPVYGAAEGGDGVMILDSDPIEYVERTPELQEVKGAYAVYVLNDSMFPAYEPGDKVHIHPGKPIAPGKDVLFMREEKDGTRHALIKRLVRVSDKSWKVRQFNPDHTFELPRKIWQRAYRIVGSTRAD
jgi:phage repressor protein C with HTH and peptisase S24 domain